jgi:hypothetical protein
MELSLPPDNVSSTFSLAWQQWGIKKSPWRVTCMCDQIYSFMSVIDLHVASGCTTGIH